MTAEELMVGISTSPKLRYIQQMEGDPTFDIVEVDMTSRGYDVSDVQARYAAAVGEYPPLPNLPRAAAQLFINKEHNTAALAVYRLAKGEPRDLARAG